MNPKTILAAVKRLAKKHAKKFKLIIDDLQMPYEISPEHHLVKTYVDACKKMKCPSVLKGSEGATVITFFQKKKIPAIATGYGSRKTAHSTDEYAKIDTLYNGTKVLEQFLKEWK
jgi:acetylornithine deacetylase/succinyl-diaminopimelate desuccinylase-like protein